MGKNISILFIPLVTELVPVHGTLPRTTLYQHHFVSIQFGISLTAKDVTLVLHPKTWKHWNMDPHIHRNVHVLEHRDAGMPRPKETTSIKRRQHPTHVQFHDRSIDQHRQQWALHRTIDNQGPSTTDHHNATVVERHQVRNVASNGSIPGSDSGAFGVDIWFQWLFSE